MTSCRSQVIDDALLNKSAACDTYIVDAMDVVQGTQRIVNVGGLCMS